MPGFDLTDEEREFLLDLIEASQKTLEINFGKQGMVYARHEKIIHEKGFEYFYKLLESLRAKGYLKIINENYNIFCPHCQFPYVYTKYSCPVCYSTHIEHVQLIQHPFCGFIGKKKQFQQEDELVCPNCETCLSETEGYGVLNNKNSFKTLGFSFECENSHKFERPNITHLCPNCQAKFNYRESDYRPIYDFELTPKTFTLITQEIDIQRTLERIHNLLEELGYVPSFNEEIIGFSSSTHSFDLTGKKDGRIILFDLANQSVNDELIKLLGKKMDIENSTAVFLDVKGNKEIMSLGQVYGINIVDLTESNWFDTLKNWLNKLEPMEKKTRLLNRLRR